MLIHRVMGDIDVRRLPSVTTSETSGPLGGEFPQSSGWEVSQRRISHAKRPIAFPDDDADERFRPGIA